MVQRYEQTRKLQWYKRGAAYFLFGGFEFLLMPRSLETSCLGEEW